MINSDLALEFAKDKVNGEAFCEEQNGIVKKIEVKDASIFLERCGVYFHIDCNNIDCDLIENAVAGCVKQFDFDRQKILFVGLGNAKYISDALGELVVDKLPLPNEQVAKIKPQGARETGIETHDLIIAAKKFVKPTMIVAIDSLATNNIDNIGKSIQITNVGLTPGSGVGNSRKILSQKSLGIPIVAIGVPLVANIKIEDKKRLVIPVDIEDIAIKLANAIANGIRQVIG